MRSYATDRQDGFVRRKPPEQGRIARRYRRDLRRPLGLLSTASATKTVTKRLCIDHLGGQPGARVSSRADRECTNGVASEAEYRSRFARLLAGKSWATVPSNKNLFATVLGPGQRKMDIPTELPGILSWFGLPAGAVALGYGLVKGAESLEADASENALKYISGLLKKGPITSFGALGAAVVPFVFDKVFGDRPFRLKFVSRSILASICFWIILASIKHPNWQAIWFELIKNGNIIWYSIPITLLVDWMSLTKAKIILNVMPKSGGIAWTVVFVLVDIALTGVILLLWIPAMSALMAIWGLGTYLDIVTTLFSTSWNIIIEQVYAYLGGEQQLEDLSIVFIPSTLLTSAWVLLFLLSSIVASLLRPLEYLRRFALWWFDIDKHPLKAIAKVAAVLIVVGAFTVKAMHWGWMIV